MSFFQIVSHGSVLHFRSSIRTANSPWPFSGRSLAASCSRIILCYNSSSQKTRCLWRRPWKVTPQNRRNPLETWDGWRSSWDPDVFLQRAQKVGELQSICLNISTIIDSVYICNIFKPNSLYIRILIVMHTCIHTYLPTYITLHHITFHYRYRYIYIYIQLFLHSSPMENSLVLCWGSGLQWGDLQGFRARQNLALVAPRKSTSLGFLRRVAVEGRWMTLGRCDGKKVKVGWKIVSTFQKHLCEKRMDWKYMSGNGTKLWDVKLLKTSNVDEIQYSKEKQQ